MPLLKKPPTNCCPTRYTLSGFFLQATGLDEAAPCFYPGS